MVCLRVCETAVRNFGHFSGPKLKVTPIPSHISHDGKAAETSLAQAEMFNRYFHSVFVKSGNAPELLPDITECCIPELANIQFDH